jgi:hypothetical protein
MTTHTTTRTSVTASTSAMRLLAVAAVLGGSLARLFVPLPDAASAAAWFGAGAGVIAFLLLHVGTGKAGREVLALALGVELAAIALTAVL